MVVPPLSRLLAQVRVRIRVGARVRVRVGIGVGVGASVMFRVKVLACLPRRAPGSRAAISVQRRAPSSETSYV